jgi:hypothetical protein
VDTIRYIRELIYEHDCVIVPGFGALIGNYLPAHFDRVRQIFHPPSRQITFNRRLNHHDGLLSGLVSRDLKINYTDAKALVDQFVVNLNKTLARGETVSWEGIGRFLPEKPDKLLFEQEASVNLLAESHGLMSFHFPGLREREEARRKEKRFRGIDIHRHEVKKRKYVLAAFIGIPVLVAAIAFASFGTRTAPNYKVEVSSLNPFTPVVKPVPESQPEIRVELPEASQGEVETTLRGMTDKKTALYYEEEKEKPSLPMEPEEVFYLIAGSFRNYDNALHLKQELEAQGFGAEIIGFDQNLFRVSLRNYSNRELAVNELYKLRAMKEFEEVWLLSK